MIQSKDSIDCSAQVELRSLVGRGAKQLQARSCLVSSPPDVTESTQTRTKENHSMKKCLLIGFLFPLLLLILFILLPLTETYFHETKSVKSSTYGANMPTFAFCGNSMTYYNDLPRLVEILLAATHSSGDLSQHWPPQNSCLRGGSNLESLWQDGNGMRSRFTLRPGTNDTIGAPTVQSLLSHSPSPAAYWDFVVLQDDELFVTNSQNRETSLEALRRYYLPQLRLQDSTQGNKTVVIFLETFAYKSSRLRQKIHLGGMDEFTLAISEGVRAYQNLVGKERPSHIIPMATAVHYISVTYPELQDKLYNDDDVHPSPHCTWLQACLLVAVSTARSPPSWDSNIRQQWKDHARHWSSFPDGKKLPVPDDSEAQLLRQVACQFADVDCSR